MFGWLKQSRVEAGVVPAGVRVYAIGDVHGRLDLVQGLWEMIVADAQSWEGEVQLVGLGDYSNRGPDSAGVLRWARELVLPARWRAVWLRGNHDQALLDFLGTGGKQTEWLDWGGWQAITSWGLAVRAPDGRPREAPALAMELEEVLANNGDLAWLTATALHHSVGGWVLVHAGVRRGIALRDQMPHDLMMIREEFVGQPHELPCRVLYGHTIWPDVKIEDDKVGIDTGAYDTGVLTCAVLEGRTVRPLQTVSEKGG